MTMRAQVVGAWTAARTPALLVDYPHPGVRSCDDVTGTAAVPPSPNLGVWEITADDAVEAAIETDSRYLVLWSEAVISGN